MFSKIKNRKAEQETQPEQTTKRKRGVSALIITLVLIGVAVVGGGIIAAIVITSSSGTEDEVSSLAGDAAVYDANCDLRAGIEAGRIGAIDDYDTTTDNDIEFVYAGNTGYQHPDGDFDALTLNAARGAITLSGTAVGDPDVGFVHTISDITEIKFNTDFDGNGRINEGQVVAILAEGDRALIDVDSTQTSNIAGAPPVIVADPGADIDMRVGSRIIVNRRDGCWGVRV